MDGLTGAGRRSEPDAALGELVAEVDDRAHRVALELRTGACGGEVVEVGPEDEPAIAAGVGAFVAVAPEAQQRGLHPGPNAPHQLRALVEAQLELGDRAAQRVERGGDASGAWSGERPPDLRPPARHREDLEGRPGGEQNEKAGDDRARQLGRDARARDLVVRLLLARVGNVGRLAPRRARIHAHARGIRRGSR